MPRPGVMPRHRACSLSTCAITMAVRAAPRSYQPATPILGVEDRGGRFYPEPRTGRRRSGPFKACSLVSCRRPAAGLPTRPSERCVRICVQIRVRDSHPNLNMSQPASKHATPRRASRGGSSGLGPRGQRRRLGRRGFASARRARATRSAVSRTHGRVAHARPPGCVGSRHIWVRISGAHQPDAYLDERLPGCVGLCPAAAVSCTTH